MCFITTYQCVLQHGGIFQEYSFPTNYEMEHLHIAVIIEGMRGAILLICFIEAGSSIVSSGLKVWRTAASKLFGYAFLYVLLNGTVHMARVKITIILVTNEFLKHASCNSSK